MSFCPRPGSRDGAIEWLHCNQYCWLMPVSTPTAATTSASVILRLVWFLQTELFHIIGTNWGNGEITLVPERSYFLSPTSPLGIERQQCSQSLSVSSQRSRGAWPRRLVAPSLLLDDGGWKACSDLQLHVLPEAAGSGTVTVPSSWTASQGRCESPSCSPHWPQAI